MGGRRVLNVEACASVRRSRRARGLPAVVAGLVVLILAPGVWAGSGALLLVGGGAEGADGDVNSWSWEPYSWFVARALAGGPNGGNGRIAIVDTVRYPQCTQADRGYCAYFTSLGAVEAVALHVSRDCAGAPGCLDADAPATFEAVRAFDGVWLRGGDQSDYVDAWGASELARGLASIHGDGGVLGGTSAGAMVLSSVTSVGDATSWEATGDPFHPRIAFDTTLLGGDTALTPPLLVDTHFTTRARLGRLAVFLARWQADTGASVLGAGIDEHTALAVDGDGRAQVMGEGAVSFLQPAVQADLIAGQPPFLADARLEQLTAGFIYDLVERRILTVPDDAQAAGAPPPPPRYGRTLLTGASVPASRSGERWTFWRDGQDLYTGALRALPGRNVLGGTVVSTLLEDETALREVRMGGPQWLLAGPLRHGLAVYLDGYLDDAFNRVLALPDATLRVLPAPASPEQSAVFLDCHGLQWVAASAADPDGDGLPRQSVALAPCAVHLLNSQVGARIYDVAAHAPRG